MGKAIILKSPAELQAMREANLIVAETLDSLSRMIRPGESTWHLDKWAENFVRERGATCAFKGYRGYPKCLCVSINDQVVHGIPSKKVIIRDGDIVSIDFGVRLNGYYGDAAITVAAGNVGPEKADLLRVTREALYKGIDKARVGNRINDISSSVQRHVEKHGFSVVRQYVGHGIGSNLHEPPEIPNFSVDKRTARIMPGMVLAIEPMVNMGSYEVKIMPDGWTVVTKDNSVSAHFEHSIAVTEDGPVILSEM